MTNRPWILIVFAVVALLSMVPMSWRAIEVRGVFDNAELMKDVWFQVTLLDAYLAFVAVWLFACRCETSHIAKLLWLIAFLCFGSMAIGIYFLKLAMTHSSNGWGNSETSA